jgi:hypothetical protein
MVVTLREATVLARDLVAVTREAAVDVVCDTGAAVRGLAAALVVEFVLVARRFAVAAELVGWTGAA